MEAYKMKVLIERCYESLIKRDIINENTTLQEFIDKIKEEHQEFLEEWERGVFVNDKSDPFYEELTDYITAGIMLMRHHNINFLEMLEKIVIKNEIRCKNYLKK